LVKTALGRGLDALIPGKGGQEIVEIDIARVAAAAEQPRKVFRDETLRELAASIKEKGVLQPLIVAREDGGTFRLIAGERRLRACQMAGLRKVPAIIRETDPEDALEIALIENIQREDLGPVETAQAFRRLMKQFGLTQEKLSEKVGKDRATVANYLRLLKLPEEIKALMNDGRLSMGHARAILSLEGGPAQMEAARKIVGRGLSVREAEALAKRGAKPARAVRKKRPDPQIASLEDRLKRSLGTKVSIKHAGKRGRIEIEYYSLEELDRLLDLLLQ
jgi:ParB family chromosome partitioning protein